MGSFEEKREDDRVKARFVVLNSARRIVELGDQDETRITNLLLIDEGQRLSTACSHFKVKRECHLDDVDCGDGTEDI